MNIRKIIILCLVFLICIILHKCYTLHTNNKEDFSSQGNEEGVIEGNYFYNPGEVFATEQRESQISSTKANIDNQYTIISDDITGKNRGKGICSIDCQTQKEHSGLGGGSWVTIDKFLNPIAGKESNEYKCKEKCLNDPNCLALTYLTNPSGAHNGVAGWGNMCRFHYKNKENLGCKEVDSKYKFNYASAFVGGSCFVKKDSCGYGPASSGNGTSVCEEGGTLTDEAKAAKEAGEKAKNYKFYPGGQSKTSEDLNKNYGVLGLDHQGVCSISCTPADGTAAYAGTPKDISSEEDENLNPRESGSNLNRCKERCLIEDKCVGVSYLTRGDKPVDSSITSWDNNCRFHYKNENTDKCTIINYNLQGASCFKKLSVDDKTKKVAADNKKTEANTAFEKLETEIDASSALFNANKFEDYKTKWVEVVEVGIGNVKPLYTSAQTLYTTLEDLSSAAEMTSKITEINTLQKGHKIKTYSIEITDQVTKSEAVKAVLDEIKAKMKNGTPTLTELDEYNGKLATASSDLDIIISDLGDIKLNIDDDLYGGDIKTLYDNELIKITALKTGITEQIAAIVTAKVPVTTVPGTTLPGTTLPGTTLPGTTLPGTTLPGTTLPGTTLPGTTVPGTTLSPEQVKMKALIETQLSPMMEQIKNIKASQKAIKDDKAAQNALNLVAKEAEEAERIEAKEAEVEMAKEKHDSLLEQITGLETSLKKEIEKGADSDVTVIKSLDKMLTNQTDKLSALNSNKADDPKLKALQDKVHESHNLLKSQTNELTKLLSQPKTSNTTMKIDKLKNSMLAVEKVIENQTMNISNTVKKSQNNELSQLALMGQMAPMSTQMPMLPMSYSSNSNIDNSHHNKLNNIIESIEKLNPKTMNDKEFERLKPRLNQLDNLDKEKLLGLLDSTLAVDVNSNNSKDLQDIVSYTKKLIASKSNLNSYNTNENNILLQEFKTAIKNKTLRKLTKYDRDILMSTPDSELWKQIIYLNKKYSDQNPYDTTYVPGYVYMPPDKWETRREIPKCINDKAPISSPAFVFGSGVPSNALEFDSKLLPRFSYREEGSGVFTDDEKFNKEYTNSIMEETDRERLVLSASNTDKYVEKIRKQHSTNHRFDDYNL